MVNDDFIHSQRVMQRFGIRRLLVISGEAQWCRWQAEMLSSLLEGDWLWVTDAPRKNANFIPPQEIKKLLGQERLHAVFDALSGLDIAALAVLAGMLRAGSWLLLLVPQWSAWPYRPDNDSLRWSEQSAPISTPNFIHYFQQQLVADSDVVLWHQGDNLVIPKNRLRRSWQPPSGKPGAQQRAILAQLVAAKSGIWGVTAPRGRGKSALAGMLIAQNTGLCWVTGPSKAATQVIRQWAGGNLVFFAPDRLLAHCQMQDVSEVDWLLIDEAAAIPVPLLHALIGYFPKVLLTTTVHGYEGSGHGFALKFCALLPDWRGFTLTEPTRWAADDPLERLLDNTLLLHDKILGEQVLGEQVLGEETLSDTVITSLSPKFISIRCEQSDWLASPQLLQRFYGLLATAHYRTSPLDLRRLMDAPRMQFTALVCGEAVAGALWLVEEGGLDTDLAHDVWAGRRRPKGSLVAQSLAAHGGLWLAPTLLSWRISRVAVAASLRRQGIARKMIFAQRQHAQCRGIDFLSVSFGYSPELALFWQACGFELVRAGVRREASSGSYTAMAIFPLSASARILCRAAQRQLARDWHWLSFKINFSLPVTCPQDDALNEDDWRALAGFAFAFRTPDATWPALQRLLVHSSLPLPALRQYLQSLDRLMLPEGVTQSKVASRKVLVQQWRQEAALAMVTLDKQRCLFWQKWAAPRH